MLDELLAIVDTGEFGDLGHVDISSAQWSGNDVLVCLVADEFPFNRSNPLDRA